LGNTGISLLKVEYVVSAEEDNIMKAIIAAVLLVITTTSIAADRQSACVKYKKSIGWSKSYSVTATVMSGSELNSATSSFKYNGFGYYAAIFWDDDEVTILKLPSLSMGNLPMFSSDVKDQYGRKWQIQSGSICM